MPSVDIVINGRTYGVSCGDGEELRLKRLAQYVDARVREQVEAAGPLGDARLLVLTSLLIADELDDALSEIKRLQAGQRSRAPAPQEADAAETVERIAERLERLAADMENT